MAMDKDTVVRRLWPIGAIDCRAMFGAYGFYCDGRFFAILDEGQLYFKTNESTRQPYLEFGMAPFEPSPGHFLKNYLKVPGEVQADPERLCEWAKTAASLPVTTKARRRQRL